jgi:hypothetical protein
VFAAEPEDLLPVVVAMAAPLEALDLGYLRVPSGVDFPFCADLFHRKPLLHLDLSGVMQWKIFDPVLEMILAELPGLESLAIQGLQLSDAVFGRFCRGCRQLRHLQMRGCSTPQAPFVAPAYTACKNLRVADFAGTMALLTPAEAAELRLFMAQLDEFALTAVLDANQGGLSCAIAAASDLQAAARQAGFRAAVGVVTQDRCGAIEIHDTTPGVAAHHELQACVGGVDRFFSRIFNRLVISVEG